MDTNRINCWLACVAIAAIANAQARAQAPDQVPPELELLSPGVKLTLVAEHPDVVTPTGIDIDDRGTLWVALSHTHFRPEDYDGPEHDEIITIAPDGIRKVFYNRTDATMDLELGSDGWVYLTERDRVLRVRDTDGDGVGDQEQDIAILKTEADYPHNGLSGMAWHPDGDLIFALGENFWKAWTLTAPIDGSAVKGSGEGGIFRCRPDGAKLKRIARGFWNPFGICVRADGTMFAGENDPGSRPPCRLLHIVEGGDYGYQRRYGNAPIHPFVCWNGELPGTLPMMHSVGEAPCGIAPLGNGLVVGSWTDHRIDFYPLTADGASFKTKRVTLVRGGHHFRPTCIVQQSPTVFYLTDWVFGSYQLHKRGRVWKLEIDPARAGWLGELELAPPNNAAIQARQLRAGDRDFPLAQLYELAQSQDPFMARAAIDGLAKRIDQLPTGESDAAGSLSAADRITLLLATRKAHPLDGKAASRFLNDSSEDVVFEALRWIADDELTGLLPEVERRLADPGVSYRIFEACLAARNALKGKPEAGVVDAAMLMKQIKDDHASPATRAFALRLIDPDHKGFNDKVYRQLLSVDDQTLLGELTRTLAASEKPAAQKVLVRIASDQDVAPGIRADAIAGIAVTPKLVSTLIEFADSSDAPIRDEALRALRFGKLSESQRRTLATIAEKHPGSADIVDAALHPDLLKSGRPQPEDTAAWQKRLAAIEAPPDLDAGRRTFHHRSIGTCTKCHRHSGRGNVVGPDLTRFSAGDDNTRSLTSLLQPGKDVDPQYYARTIMTEDGDVFTGIMLRDGGGGTEFYRDNTGRERRFSTKDIVTRKELKTSLMPDGLIDLMTDREIRDVLAFLDQQSTQRHRTAN